MPFLCNCDHFVDQKLQLYCMKSGAIVFLNEFLFLIKHHTPKRTSRKNNSLIILAGPIRIMKSYDYICLYIYINVYHIYIYI